MLEDHLGPVKLVMVRFLEVGQEVENLNVISLGLSFD